jgi:hypothetical protein
MRSTHGSPSDEALRDAVRDALSGEQPGAEVPVQRAGTGVDRPSKPAPSRHRGRSSGGRPSRQPNRTHALRRRGG